MRSLVLTFVVCLLSTSVARAAEEPKTRDISTSGEAVVYVSPDEVILNVGVETRDPSLDKAKATNDEAAARLVAAVKKIGVEEKYIQTDHLDIQIVYRDNHELTISGYSTRRGYSITLKDPKKFQLLVETAIKNGANRLNGFEFRTTELRKHRDHARAMAIKAAKEKADALAGELKCKVGQPRTINETSGSYGYWGGRGNWNSMAQNSVQFVPGGGGEEDGGTLPLGQIAVRANVTVVFDLIVL